MRGLVLLTGILGCLVIVSCGKHDAKEILIKSFEKCQSIENGNYNMTMYSKIVDDNDTSSRSYSCYFRKLTEDSIFSSAFHSEEHVEGNYYRDILYTGDDFVSYSKKDSSGEIKSKTLWAENIKSIRHNYEFFSPLTNKGSYPLPDDSSFVDNELVFEYIGEEMINNISCFHVKVKMILENDSAEIMKALRAEDDFWINKKNYIPMQYSTAYDLVIGGDTVYQFEKFVLEKYELNHLKNDDQLSLTSIPSFITLSNYRPEKYPELLPKGTVAPEWSLVSLNDDTIRITDLKGELILIDFFFKACYPCIQALPALQNLHEKYSDKGLRIIGIDSYDTKEEDDIDNFLAKQGVSYTVLLGGKDVEKDYHVSSFPTIYLIDKEGNVLYTQMGYSAGAEEKIEEVIKQNL